MNTTEENPEIIRRMARRIPLLDSMTFTLHGGRNRKAAINKVDYVEPTDGSLDLAEVIGREDEVPFLLHDLIANSKSNCNRFTALGIAGTAGSGKTTICQMMFNDEQVQGHFLPRIWVCMTKQPWDNPDPKVAVAERMLTCLGEDEEIIKEKRDKDGVSGLVSLLHRQLVGKRYLIVLDDAWDADEWYKKLDLGFGKNNSCLAFGLPKGYGGAVIVNGRSDTLVEMMVGKENLHHLLPLTDEDCWAIFTKASGVDDLQRDTQVEELWRFVVQGAAGHPLMAKIIGQSYTRAEDTAQQAADNTNVSSGEESAIGQANRSNGPSIAQVTELEVAQVTAPQPFYSSNGSSMAQVTRPALAQVTALQPVNSSTSSSTAQVTGPAQVTISQPVNSSSDSSAAQVTGPESAQVTAPGSSIAQVAEPESAQVTTSQPVNSGTGSPMEEFIGPDRAEVIAPQSVDSGDVKKTWLNRTKSLGSLRVKFPFGLGRSKTMGP